MNKAVKISLAVLVPVIAAILVILVFFPGLPEYIRIKHDNEYIDKTVPVLKASVPADYKNYDVDYLSLSAPDGLTVSGHKLSAGEKGKLSFTVLRNDAVQTKKLLEEYGEGASDEWESYNYSEKEYKSYFKAVGEKYPDINYPETDVLWYIKDKLTASDCLKLRGEDMDVFKEFADAKKFSWETEDAWKISGDGYSGYVCRINKGSIGTEKGSYTLTVFPDSGNGISYFGMLRNADDETAKNMLGSVKLDK